MDAIKEYKQLTTIQLFEGELQTTIGIDELEKILNNDMKFIRIGDNIIAKNQIKKCHLRSIDSIENYILSQPKDIQDILRTREKEKKEKVGRTFDSIQEVCNYLSNKGIAGYNKQT